METIGAGLALVGILWMAAFGYAHFRAVSKAAAAETWPTAIGRVVSCEIVEEHSRSRQGHRTTWYNPVVTYGYSVGGKSLTGRRLRFGSYRSASRKKAEKMVAPYAAGSTAMVRYNPERHGECVLETRGPGPIYLVMALFGLIFVAFGLFWGRMLA